MALIFYGKWIVEVVSKNGSFEDRFVISGAAVGDGTYAGVVGTSVQVEGPKWQIAFEQTALGIPSAILSERELSDDFLLDRGLVVTIGVDDNFDQDFNDLIVRLRNVDPSLNPFVPVVNLPDFTYKRRKPSGKGNDTPPKKPRVG